MIKPQGCFMRYLCIHCHFYQPPRENPWLEQIEQQDSAAPNHDWNARINDECYARNAAARILDGRGRIDYIVNNYSRISFNFGPTLLSWMEQNAPETYGAILEADAESRGRFHGHGSAIAQVYNHMIMPLANTRDKRTQILWGIHDFRSRFGRLPEGMWLAETAVDSETLSLLAAEGISFTILAPSQAGAERDLGATEWRDVNGARIDPTRAYLVQTRSGPIHVFFYDGPVSRAVAFEGLLNNGVKFAERLLGAFPPEEDRGQLMHIATDGETYGHHHRFGEMALAYALHYIEENGLARITNYGEFLELHPPDREAGILENTAWSCVHGVGRWAEDCGCNSGSHPGWRQRWRAPLRAAFDWLRDTLAPFYEQKASTLFQDPWTARDEYISVIVNRTAEARERFLTHHCAGGAGAGAHSDVWKLLEMQRHLMLMYTSCGWFFDELSGIETVQVMQYAARAVQLAEELFGQPFEEPLLERLAAAPSNLAEHEDGRAIYRRLVHPAMVNLEKAGAHFAVSSMYERAPDRSTVYCYDIEREFYRELQSGHIHLGIGRARVSSRITLDSERLVYAVLHFGDQNIHARVGRFVNAKSFDRAVANLSAAFDRNDLAAVIRIMDRNFPSEVSLRSMFKDAQRRIAGQILSSAIDDTETAHRRLYERHVPLLRLLHELGIPVPDSLRTAAEFALNGMLKDEFAAPALDLARIRALLADSSRAGICLNAPDLERHLVSSIDRLAACFFEHPQDLPALERLLEAVTFAQSLPFPVTLWSLQNRCYDLYYSAFPRSDAWSATFRSLAEQLRMNLRT
jgi:alpha-amylase/alpha-mannosidase (GH57 family)